MSHISGLAEADDTRKRILELWANICDAYISVQWTSKLVNRRYFGSLTILPQAMSANVPRSSRFHAAREDRPGSGPLLTPKASDQRKLQIIKVEPRSKPACLIRRIRSHVSESRSLPVRSKATSLQKDLLIEGGSPSRRGGDRLQSRQWYIGGRGCALAGCCQGTVKARGWLNRHQTQSTPHGPSHPSFGPIPGPKSYIW